MLKAERDENSDEEGSPQLSKGHPFTQVQLKKERKKEKVAYIILFFKEIQNCKLLYGKS